MEHPNKDVIYILSYPRSGSGWFRYCLKFITNADAETTSADIAYAVYDHTGRHSDSELSHHSHRTTNELWNIENCFDIKNILLLRNYKEAIFSEMKSVYGRSEESLSQNAAVFLPGIPYTPPVGRWMTVCFNYVEILKHIAEETNPEFQKFAPDDWRNKEYIFEKFPYLFAEVPKNETNVALALSFLKADQFFGDFALAGFPTSENHPTEPKKHFMEWPVSASIANHYHFALQLKRYYNLLEYHDKVSKTNPNNALIVKYEDFMENPFFELSNVINFIEDKRLASPERIDIFRGNLYKLIDNIEHHKHTSINKYRAPSLEEGRYIAHSYEKDNEYNFHSSMCRKKFLVEIDNVLKNKNLELYNKYLSDYEEKD